MVGMVRKILLICMVLANVCFAKVQVITINHGVVAKIPVAIQAISDNSPGSSVSEVIYSDLLQSGLIRIIDSKAHTQKIRSMSEPPKYTEWKSIGAHFLVVFEMKQVDGRYQVEFKVYDTIIGKLVDHYNTSASMESLRNLAHRISNTVYARVTGDEGYFTNKVAFVNEVSKRQKQICIMDIDGYNQKVVVSGPRIYLSPRLSPNGKTLVYFSYKQGRSTYRRNWHDVMGEVYVMDLPTATIRSLILPPHKRMSYAPRFSPDGNTLVMSLADNSGGSAIYSYSLITREFRQLTHSVARSIDTSPCYSPDGKNIVFNSDRSGTQQLYVMPASGGQIKRLSFGTGRYATPVWSPRGDYIAFARITEGEFYIGVMRPDGSGERMIASGYVVENPAWVRNGRVLLYTKMASRRGEYAIYSVDVTGNYGRIIKGRASDPDIADIN